MMHEVQIVIRHTDPAKLSDDVRAVSEFIEKLKRDPGHATNDRLTGRRRRHLQAVVSGA
jgi:hypothetical protein